MNVTVDPQPAAAVRAAAPDLLLRQRAAGLFPAPRTALTLAELRKLTALLRPIFGSAAHVLVSGAAARAANREALIDNLAQELTDPVLGESFRIAARVALAQC